MTLLTAINEVADTVGLSRFTSVIGSEDENAQTMVALAKQAGEEITRRVDWQQMLKSYTITLAPSPIPNDYQRLIPGSPIRLANGYPVRPVTNGSQWAVVTLINSPNSFFFIQSNQINIWPWDLSSGAVMDYVSKNWIKNVNVTVSEWAADDNTVLFPEILLVKNITWRWKRKNGLPFEDNLAEFEAELINEIKADRGAM